MAAPQGGPALQGRCDLGATHLPTKATRHGDLLRVHRLEVTAVRQIALNSAAGESKTSPRDATLRPHMSRRKNGLREL